MRGKGGRVRYSEIIRGLRNAIGVDFDWQERRMYWTDVLTDKIQRAKFDGSQIETVISGGLISAEGEKEQKFLSAFVLGEVLVCRGMGYAFPQQVNQDILNFPLLRYFMH